MGITCKKNEEMVLASPLRIIVESLTNDGLLRWDIF